MTKDVSDYDRIYTAHWDGDAYRLDEEFGYDWMSADGDEWTTGDGIPVESDEFSAARIDLIGGPCDGQRVA